jgi:membrane-associated phospholipid phosphatase
MKGKIILCIMILHACLMPAWAGEDDPSPYLLTPEDFSVEKLKYELSFLTFCSGTFFFGSYIKNNTESIYEEYPDNLNIFDNEPVGSISYSKSLDRLSIVFLLASWGAGGASCLASSSSFIEFCHRSAVCGEIILLSHGLKDVLKGAFPKYRPTKNDDSAGDEIFSFPSGHTSLAFAAVSYSFYSTFTEKSENRTTLQWSLPFIALAGACCTAVFRVVSGSHDIADVLCGAALGAAVGIAVPWTHDSLYKALAARE